MSFRRIPIVLLALMALNSLLACSTDEMLRRLTPHDADVRARAYLGLLARGEIPAATERLAPVVASPAASQELQRLGLLLAGRRFDSTRVIGAKVRDVGHGVRYVNLSYEMRSPEGWMLANVVTVDSAGGWWVLAVSARPLKQSLEQFSAFTLRGRTAWHFAWLILTPACALFTLAVACFIGMQKGMPRRWGWTFAALVGVCRFQINWANGAMQFMPVQLSLFAASAMRAAPVAPWILSFSIPVGALLALRRYRKWKRAPASPRAPSPGRERSNTRPDR